VYEAGVRTRRVYLPEGNWVNMCTKEVIQGGIVVAVDVPLEGFAGFVKAGSEVMREVLNG